LPYFLLAAGLILGLVGLYKFFMTANARQIKVFVLSATTLTLLIALFFMAISGRLATAIALVAAIWPLASAWWYRREKGRERRHDQTYEDFKKYSTADSKLGRREALDVLGLSEGADSKQINEAYKKLIQKVHPDREGSKWLAAKINEARDVLLRERR
jgi:hypothetical protein